MYLYCNIQFLTFIKDTQDCLRVIACYFDPSSQIKKSTNINVFVSNKTKRNRQDRQLKYIMIIFKCQLVLSEITDIDPLELDKELKPAEKCMS
jgi:hypothetical protein